MIRSFSFAEFVLCTWPDFSNEPIAIRLTKIHILKYRLHFHVSIRLPHGVHLAEKESRNLKLCIFCDSSYSRNCRIVFLSIQNNMDLLVILEKTTSAGKFLVLRHQNIEVQFSQKTFNQWLYCEIYLFIFVLDQNELEQAQKFLEHAASTNLVCT